MYAETKRRTFFQIGIFTGAMGVLLTLLGLYYVNDPTYFADGSLILQRAATLWGGILLVAFAVRNVTLAFPATRFREEGAWDQCSAVLTNLTSLVISGAVVGITLWSHVHFFRAVPNMSDTEVQESREIVNLVSILLVGILVILASLVGAIIGCFPVSDADEAAAAGEQYGMDNHGFNKH